MAKFCKLKFGKPFHPSNGRDEEKLKIQDFEKTRNFKRNRKPEGSYRFPEEIVTD